MHVRKKPVSSPPHEVRHREVLRRIGRARRRVASNLEAVARKAEHTGRERHVLLGGIFAEFCDELMHILVEALGDNRDPNAVQWVHGCFQEWIARVAEQLRGATSGASSAHALAQALQYRMFEAEARLSRSLGISWGAKSPTEELSRGSASSAATDENVPMADARGTCHQP
jgi:hypothetical protein